MTNGSDSLELGSLYKHAPIWLTLYAIILGAIYQTSYWSPFHINITQYLGLQDLIRISVFPLIAYIGAATALIVGQAFAMDSWIGLPSFARDPVIPAKPIRNGRGLAFLIVTLPLAVYGVVVIIWNWDSAAANALLTGFVSSVGFIVARRSRVLNEMKWRFARDLLLAATVSGLAMAFGLGRLHAWLAMEKRDFVEAKLTEQDETHIFPAKSTDPIVFLGHIGQYDFFYRSKLTYIVRSSELHAFAVNSHIVGKVMYLPFLDSR